MKINIRAIILLIAIAIPLVFSSCDDRGGKRVGGSVALLFPIDESNPRWAVEEGQFNKRFAELNYYVGYARAKEGDVKGQVDRIKWAENYGFRTIVFVSVNTGSKEIANALEKYVRWGGKVVCYDRLQSNTDAVSAYVAPSNDEISALHYDACKDMPQGSTIEFLAGPAIDTNAMQLFESLYSRVAPKIESGYWTTPSGNTTFDQVKLEDWSMGQAYIYTKKILDTYYTQGTLPTAIMAINDEQAAGVALAVEQYNKVHGSAPYPIITGMDKTNDALIRIVKHEQTMTIDRNTTWAIDRTVELIGQLNINEPIKLKDKVNNGKIDVPYAKVPDLKPIYRKDIINN